MIFFFGIRASKIKDRKIRKTTCLHCKTEDSLVISTYSKYFHFFWIPIIPLYKTNIAECTHCRKSCAQHEFTTEMNAALKREHEQNPVKRPIWQGCGCMILMGFFSLMFAISLYGVYSRSQNGEPLQQADHRKTLLDNDIKKLSTILQRDKDSITIALKKCLSYDIEIGIETDKIEYFSSLKKNKILVLLRIKDLKGIAAKERKIIIDIVEDCLSDISYLGDIEEQYIGVEGKWNTVLIKTPTAKDLDGRFADKSKLLPFYDTKEVAKSTEYNG